MKMEYKVIEEGHVRARRDMRALHDPDNRSDHDVNMWYLDVKDARGWFRETQWMHISNIQAYFTQKLPRYKVTGTIANPVCVEVND